MNERMPEMAQNASVRNRRTLKDSSSFDVASKLWRAFASKSAESSPLRSPIGRPVAAAALFKGRQAGRPQTTRQRSKVQQEEVRKKQIGQRKVKQKERRLTQKRRAQTGTRGSEGTDRKSKEGINSLRNKERQKEKEIRIERK